VRIYIYILLWRIYYIAVQHEYYSYLIFCACGFFPPTSEHFSSTRGPKWSDRRLRVGVFFIIVSINTYATPAKTWVSRAYRRSRRRLNSVDNNILFTIITVRMILIEFQNSCSYLFYPVLGFKVNGGSERTYIDFAWCRQPTRTHSKNISNVIYYIH